jgi:holo-[acyl-carrier protein] synthase
MAESAQLRSVLAEFLDVEPTAIGPDTLLGPRLSSSLARAGLDAALRRRLGVKCPAVYSVRSYRELEAAVFDGEVPESASPAEVQRVAEVGVAADNVRCGIDIVEIAELPEASDYWEHEFYRHAFSAAEIAYCVTQPSPREHFAARWAAKEAVKKLSAAYLAAELAELEVGLAADGAPEIRRRGALLPVALSLSHSPSTAVAVAMLATAASGGQRSPNASPAPQAESASPAAAAPAAPPRGQFTALWLLLLATAAVAGWALVRTWLA